MSHEIDIAVDYGAGELHIEFDADEWPENWNDLDSSARFEVKQALYEVADRREWIDSFETQREYSALPGMSVKKDDVGTLVVTDDEMRVNLDIDSIHDLNWE